MAVLGGGAWLYYWIIPDQVVRLSALFTPLSAPPSGNRLDRHEGSAVGDAAHLQQLEPLFHHEHGRDGAPVEAAD